MCLLFLKAPDTFAAVVNLETLNLRGNCFESLNFDMRIVLPKLTDFGIGQKNPQTIENQDSSDCPADVRDLTPAP